MTTYLGKSCSFCLPRVPYVNCHQFMYLVISLLVLRAGYGIWLYQFLIIAYLFTFYRGNAFCYFIYCIFYKGNALCYCISCIFYRQNAFCYCIFCIFLVGMPLHFQSCQQFCTHHYHNFTKFSDRYAWANSADPDQTALEEQSDQVYTVCHSICIVWTHYCMVEPYSSNFRVITTNILDVRIFRKLTICCKTTQFKF